jgi:hypothetical protein
MICSILLSLAHIDSYLNSHTASCEFSLAAFSSMFATKLLLT